MLRYRTGQSSLPAKTIKVGFGSGREPYREVVRWNGPRGSPLGTRASLVSCSHQRAVQPRPPSRPARRGLWCVCATLHGQPWTWFSFVCGCIGLAWSLRLDEANPVGHHHFDSKMGVVAFCIATMPSTIESTGQVNTTLTLTGAGV